MSAASVSCDRCNGEGSTLIDGAREFCEPCWGKGSFACQDGPEGCRGDVDFRNPGYGSKSYPRCERHGAARLERETDCRRKYGTAACTPDSFDAADAGESLEAL